MVAWRADAAATGRPDGGQHAASDRDRQHRNRRRLDRLPYSAQDKTFDFLAQDETLTVTYTVTVTDEHGAAATQPVIVTVTGTNDTPTITSDTAAATRAFSEQSNTPPPNPTDSTSPDQTGGTITFRDVDLTDTHQAARRPGLVWSHGAPTLQQQADLTAASTLPLTETDSTGTGAGSIAYAYSARTRRSISSPRTRP